MFFGYELEVTGRVRGKNQRSFGMNQVFYLPSFFFFRSHNMSSFCMFGFEWTYMPSFSDI